MLKLLFQSYLIVFTIPFLTFALDPKDPQSICERLTEDSAKKSCLATAQKNTLDWYAAAACNELNDDTYFLRCWNQIVDGRFNPETLDFCTRRSDEPDSDRLQCILAMKNKSISKTELGRCIKASNLEDFQKCSTREKAIRLPSSHQSGEFQDLKIEKRK